MSDEPRRLRNPIPVNRTDTVYYWRCANCGTVENVVVPKGQVPPEAPPGWIWHPYHSARFPKRASVALGCCADHAIQAARRFHEESVRAVKEGFTPSEKP